MKSSKTKTAASAAPAVGNASQLTQKPAEEIDPPAPSIPVNPDDLIFTIKVVSAKNVRGAKGDHVNCFMRVQFADFDYKDSPVVTDSPTPEFNFVVEQNFHQTLVDTFANKKVIFTLIESLPKEKTQILGTAETCLYNPFLIYQQRDPEVSADLPLPPPMLVTKDTLSISYLNPRLLPPPPKDGETPNLPELTFEASLSKPLIPPDVVENGNFITVKLDDTFPVPDEWTLKEGTEKDMNSNIYNYAVSFMIPAESTLDRLISIPGGMLTQSENPVASEAPVFGPQPIFMNKPPGDSEGGNARQNNDASASDPTKDTLTAPQTPATSEKAAPNPEVAMQSFKKVLWNIRHVVWLPPEAVVRLREKIMAKQPIDVESLGTNLGLEILLEKPLLDKKKLQPINKSVSDFIPRRVMQANLLFEKRSQKADEDYRIQIQEIVRNLIKEYGHSLAQDVAASELQYEGEISINSKSEKEEQQRRKKFMFHLNRSGSYFSFKERLKIAVVDVVRERFQRRSPFASKSELQLFMSEVYVYLVDQMHVAINKMFRDKETAFVDPTVSRTADFALLKKFADQAEEDHNTPIAATYHLERVAKYEDSTQAWFDYGCFCQRNGQSPKGVECFREILSKNPRHIPSLLALGAICCGSERYEESRVYLVTAYELQPKYYLGLAILSMYYDVTGEELESENLLAEATKLHKASNATDSLFVSTAEFLINAHAGQLAERSLAQEILQSGPTVHPYLLLAQLEIQRGKYAAASDHIRAALDVRQDDPDAWAKLAHLHFIQRQWSEAQSCYETVLSLPQEPKNLAQIYVRLGSVYLINIDQTQLLSCVTGGQTPERASADANFAKLAKTMFLRACEITPSSKSWLGVGRACMVVGDYEEAEDALSEANVLNNRDGEVWAYLSLLCIELDRLFEANQSIAQALRQGVKDVEVLRLNGLAFSYREQILPALECFRVALELDPGNEQLQGLFAECVNKQMIAAAADEVNENLI
ncbi:Cilia- and flagella-associated protein 70 [Irineochytrium annulatum]|nr:Cilia- and flagella-associated protein 70 [Irineochytrium annulatum]